jgi:hypothetical protein
MFDLGLRLNGRGGGFSGSSISSSSDLFWTANRDREKTSAAVPCHQRLATAVCPFPLPVALNFRLFGSDKGYAGGDSCAAVNGAALQRFRFARIKLLNISIGGYKRGPRSEPQLSCRRSPPSQLSSAIDIGGVTEDEAAFDVVTDVVTDGGPYLSVQLVLSVEDLSMAFRTSASR